MPEGSIVVTRFAPSPTGFLHVGGARTALFNWLLARHAGGRFLLRIEDTDLARSTEASTAAVLEDLTWMGLHHDNVDLVYQSRRKHVYDAIIERLIERGQAYEAFETPDELDAQRKQAERARRPYVYKRPMLTDAQIGGYRDEGRPSVVRFVMPFRDWHFEDAVLGKTVTLPAHQSQDFVIRKTDGMPTYHFAVVVDDAEMGVTHILRGQEHLLNTANHVALQEALGLPKPVYGHLPVILNTDGSKMSKRDRDKRIRQAAETRVRTKTDTPATLAAASGLQESLIAEWLTDDGRQLTPGQQAGILPALGLAEADLPELLVHEFRRNGYLPETLNNFLALLGWSPGGDRERMAVDDLVAAFSIAGIGKSNAKFNRDKLTAFSTEAFSNASEARLIWAFRDYLSVNPESPLNAADDLSLRGVLAMNAGFRVLRDVDEKSRFLFVTDGAIRYDSKAIDKVLLKNDGSGMAALRDVTERALRPLADWSTGALEAAVKGFSESTGQGLGKIAQPLRVAVSGTSVSPPIFDVLAFLGRERTLARVDRCLLECSPAVPT